MPLVEEALRLRMQKLASSFVKLSPDKRRVVISHEDPDPERSVAVEIQVSGSLEQAKAEAADAMWLVQLLLERGAKESQK